MHDNHPNFLGQVCQVNVHVDPALVIGHENGIPLGRDILRSFHLDLDPSDPKQDP